MMFDFIPSIKLAFKMRHFFCRLFVVMWIIVVTITTVAALMATIGGTQDDTLMFLLFLYILESIVFLIPAVSIAKGKQAASNKNVSTSQKSWPTTLILTILFGQLGIHRFYVGKIFTGLLYLFTMGGFTIGWLVDVILVLTGRFTDKRGLLINKKSPEQLVNYSSIESSTNTIGTSYDNVNLDRYISPRRIIGFVLFLFAILFVVIGIAANTDPATYNPNNMYPGITFGVIGFILLLFSIGDPKTKTELEARKKVKRERIEQRLWEITYRGIYLTKEQIQKLENKVELPVVDTPVFLKAGEIAVYYSIATRQETKNRVVGHSRSYSGGTVRIAKGFSVHTGGSSSRPIYGDVSTEYDGEIVLTNKRLVFLSEQKAFEVPYTSITAATVYSNGFSIQSKSHTYTLILPKADLAVMAFDAIRTGEIPIANTSTYPANYKDDFDNIDFEIESVDPAIVSSVDGMEGHAFEHFCAELLQKNGFSNVSVTPGSGDQGVDILAEKSGIKYAIQCKNFASALSNTPVQEVNAGKQFYNCHVGVVLTNSTFTPGAKKLADATGVLLWDRVELQKMMDAVHPDAASIVL